MRVPKHLRRLILRQKLRSFHFSQKPKQHSLQRPFFIDLLLASLFMFILSEPFFISWPERILVSCVFAFLPLKILRHYQAQSALRHAESSFLRFLEGLCSKLSAGSSLESALPILSKEFKLTYNKNSPLVQKLELISTALSMRQPITSLVTLLKEAFPCEDAHIFFELFKYQEILGDHLLPVVRQYEQNFRSKLNERAELESSNARAKTEAFMMILLPFFMLRLLSGTAIFHQSAHVIGARLLYALAYFLALSSFFVAAKILYPEKPAKKSQKSLQNKSLKASSNQVKEDKQNFDESLTRAHRLAFWEKLSAELLRHSVLRKMYFYIQNVYLHVSERLVQCVQKHLSESYRQEVLRQIQVHPQYPLLQSKKLASSPLASSPLAIFIREKIRYSVLSVLLVSVLGLFNPSALVFLLFLPIAAYFLPDLILSEKSKDRREDFLCLYPLYLSLISPFLKIGFSLKNALNMCLNVLAEHYQDPSIQNILLQHEMGIRLSDALSHELHPYRNAVVDRSVSALLRYTEDGDHESLLLLEQQCQDAWKLYANALKVKIQQRHSKLLIPMALSLFSIIAMSVAPILSQFSTGI